MSRGRVLSFQNAKPFFIPKSLSLALKSQILSKRNQNFLVKLRTNMSSSIAGAVCKPLFFRDEGHEVPLVINISNKAASNGWQLTTPCTATGTNTIRKWRGWYSSCMFFSEKPDFSLNLSCTGTPLSVNTYLNYTGTPLSVNIADLRCTGTPLSVNTVISGYWMGPDDKDECGYVEALVQRIN